MWFSSFFVQTSENFCLRPFFFSSNTFLVLSFFIPISSIDVYNDSMHLNNAYIPVMLMSYFLISRCLRFLPHSLFMLTQSETEKGTNKLMPIHFTSMHVSLILSLSSMIYTNSAFIFEIITSLFVFGTPKNRINKTGHCRSVVSFNLFVDNSWSHLRKSKNVENFVHSFGCLLRTGTTFVQFFEKLCFWLVQLKIKVKKIE